MTLLWSFEKFVIRWKNEVKIISISDGENNSIRCNIDTIEWTKHSIPLVANWIQNEQAKPMATD